MLRTRFKQSVYLIEDAQTGLCLRCPPTVAASEPPEAPTLTERALATWFPTREAAQEAFARVLGAAPFEIVRADA